jgi:hypothetical protein
MPTGRLHHDNRGDFKANIPANFCRRSIVVADQRPTVWPDRDIQPAFGNIYTDP